MKQFTNSRHRRLWSVLLLWCMSAVLALVHQSNKNNPNQRFVFEPVQGKNGVYRIISEAYGFYLLSMNEKGEIYVGYSTDDNSEFRFTEVKDWQDKRVEQPKTEWQNEAIFAINKENGHATFMPYATTAALKADARFAASGA